MDGSLSGQSDDSLIALTTHFAQVQFRLKQIISADSEHKESLLRDLEDFAFQGCTEPMTYDTAAAGEQGSTEDQRKMRSELMEKLRSQLAEIEECAQEVATVTTSDPSGRPGGGATTILPNTLAEKQKIIIETLRKRFDFEFGDLDQLSAEEVKMNVERAVHEVVDPIKSKEEYVGQLQVQIQDMERYISFLQAGQPLRHPAPAATIRSHDPDSESHDDEDDDTDSSPDTDHGIRIKRNSSLPNLKKRVSFAEDRHSRYYDLATAPPSLASRGRLVGPVMERERQPVPNYRLSLTQLDGVHCSVDTSRMEWEKADSLKDPLQQSQNDLRLSLTVMKKTLAVMQVLTLCQCGGSFQCLPRYVSDGRRKRYHSALSSLEVAVDKISVISTAISDQDVTVDARISLETDLHETVSMLLADSLRVLLEHGLLDNGKPVTFTGACFPAWRGRGQSVAMSNSECPAWQVFKHYYKVKNGESFNTRPEQMLLSAFSLPLGQNASMKRTLLSSVHKVECMFECSQLLASDTKFRALICEGFNLCHLAEWFRIIATHPSVVEDLYSVSSFIATTGFRPAIGHLERLKDNPRCGGVELPDKYYNCPEAFRNA